MMLRLIIGIVVLIVFAILFSTKIRGKDGSISPWSIFFVVMSVILLIVMISALFMGLP